MFLGGACVLFCFVTAWFTSALLLAEKAVPTVALSGLAGGIIICVIFLKRWVAKAYSIHTKIIGAIYIFYSVAVLGFCMGVPILNFALGIAAGVYTARRMYHEKAGPDELFRNFRSTALFSAAVLLMICVLMVLFAVAGRVGSKDLDEFLMGLFALELTVPATVFWTLVFLGGCGMVLLQYWLTGKAAKIAFKLSKMNS